MLIYRSIGESEFFKLLSGNVVSGKYDCSVEVQNTNNQNNVVCCFVDNIKWRDKVHRFDVVLDIPENQLIFGTGIYYAARSFAKTKVWTGRNGSAKYELTEAYLKQYDYKDIKEIHLYNHYNNTYRNKFAKQLFDLGIPNVFYCKKEKLIPLDKNTVKVVCVEEKYINE